MPSWQGRFQVSGSSNSLSPARRWYKVGICTARCTSEGLRQDRMREQFLTTPTITEHGTVKKIYACNIFQVVQLEHFHGVEPSNQLQEYDGICTYTHARRFITTHIYHYITLLLCTDISTHTHTHARLVIRTYRCVSLRIDSHRHARRQQKLNVNWTHLDKHLVIVCYC